jgi:hypothetical protein
VIVTEWEQFRALDFKRLRKLMRAPVIVDLRNIYRADEVTAAGFRYFRIGGSHAMTGYVPYRPGLVREVPGPRHAAEKPSKNGRQSDSRPIEIRSKDRTVYREKRVAQPMRDAAETS